MRLTKIVQALTVKLYEEAAKAQQAGEAGAGESAQDDNVVDAEYTEVNEEEKK